MYFSGPQFKIGSKRIIEPNTIGMIAGGTGITPMLRIIEELLQDSNLKINLIYANQNPNEIILRKVLDGYTLKYPENFHVWYTVDNTEDKNWEYSIGFVNKQMIQNHLRSKMDLVLLCGPPIMINRVCKPVLKELGHKDIYCF